MIMTKDYIKGFIEGEGCFCVGFYALPYDKVKKYSSPNRKDKEVAKVYYRPSPSFNINLNKGDIKILNAIMKFFGVGKIYQILTKKPNNVGALCKHNLNYNISGVRNCLEVIKKLGKSPFIGRKNEVYKDWMDVVYLMSNKGHLTKKGVDFILKVRAKRMKQKHKGPPMKKIKNYYK